MLNSLSMCDEWGGWESSGAPLRPPVRLSHGEFKKRRSISQGLSSRVSPRPPYLAILSLWLCISIAAFVFLYSHPVLNRREESGRSGERV